ncbi:hypothetical protein N8Z81_04540, partial [Akkermansiaceae bacterium]|nr:hypothetical protein [Akkermansiaceae bacterium]
KRVIITSQAKDIEAFFSQKGPLTHAEVAQLLEITLLAEGIAILPDPLNPGIVRMASVGPGTGTNWTPLQYIDDPLALPLTDQIVTYRMQFRNLKPEDALRVFQQVLGQSTPSGSITAVTNASSLIIKENSSLIRQLIKIKEDIDIASEITESWVTIVYADVDEIAEQLNEIYNQQSRGTTATATRRRTTGTPLPGGTGAAMSAAGGGAGEDIPIKILPDSRTNRILLVGRPTDIVTAKALISGYDIQSAEGNEFTYRLEYLRVGDFIGVAYDAIEATLSSTSTQGGGAAGAVGGNRTTNQGGSNRTTNNNNNANGGAGGGSRTSLEVQEIPTAPEALVIRKTLLVANNIENSIIVNGPPHHIQIVKDLISKLDTEGEMVVISAVIGSFGLGDDMNFGVAMAQLLAGTERAALGSFGIPGPTDGVANIVDPRLITDLASTLTAAGTAGSGLSLYGAFDDFGVFVNALEGETNFKALDRPTVTTRNNRVARIASGSRIAIPAQTTSSTQFGQQTNIEYEDVELELEIQPLINSENKVTLEISLVRDQVGQDRQVGDLVVPDISTEELTTSVTVENGSAIILGGLISGSDRETNNGVPYLRRIPGIGKLFGSTTKSNNRTELVVILRPQIISNNHEYRAFRDGYESESAFTREARQSLPNTGLLPPKGALDDSPPAAPQKKSLLQAPSTNTKDATPPRKSGAGFMKFRRRR